MKIHITIDILPSEVIALLEALKRGESAPDQETVLQEPALVKDCELNQSNAYWKERIGETVTLLDIGPDRCSVITKKDPLPIHDVDVARFTRLLPG